MPVGRYHLGPMQRMRTLLCWINADTCHSLLNEPMHLWIVGHPIAMEKTMSIEVWLAFLAASTVLLIIPGPTILLVVSYALGQGWRAALPMAIGVALGDFTAMTLSMLGVGALLAASAGLFTALKWAGAAYLIWLGIKLFRAGGTLNAEPRTDPASSVKMVGHAWLVTALNPKSITFRRVPAPIHQSPT